MSNKARRRRKGVPGEPFARVKERQAKAASEKSEKKRAKAEALIQKHVTLAKAMTDEGLKLLDSGDYREAGQAFLQASRDAHIANSEKRWL